ncbi:GNAT family N-acetyltransferase [Micromonospora polyrhachis]|uniref:RimJ/RimL family protein N-acetyltransferase n=1 Tax=Micromonospora polyrhachis TaxID=1282883 RepID=A0A7W7WQU7_9ACTN|nr:GNAT family N-acetyltransferase [Micromonospora polyrhachis]MBB4960199.1 RimJ/RimL family protein N-acetyltransferase [Micromonospora polyrhachis]
MTTVLRTEATPAAPALRLRPWSDRDVTALIEIYRDPILRQWTRLHVENAEDAVRWLDVQRQGWKSRQRLSFAVLEERPDSGKDQLVANVVLKRADPTGRTAEVGYWTAAHARGRGIAPRALETLTDWAFDTFAADGLDHLDLLHQVDNPASCRVAEKTGYRFAHTLPAQPPAFPQDGHRHVRARR